MNKYRVKHASAIGWFAQVKRGLFYSWETIGLHTNGYGEYDEQHYDYPLLSELVAIKLIQEYAKHNDTDYGMITYTDINP